VPRYRFVASTFIEPARRDAFLHFHLFPLSDSRLRVQMGFGKSAAKMDQLGAVSACGVGEEPFLRRS